MQAFCYKLISFSERITHVSTPSGAAYLVNFYEGTCICLEFQDRHLPCRPSMTVCKDQVLELEEFTSSIYTVENYRNIYLESFAMDPIRVKDLEISASCLAPLVQKKSGRPQEKRLRRSAKKKNRTKRHCTICGSKKHNRRKYDQEPDVESCSESAKENHCNRSLLFLDTESIWKGLSDDNEEQRSFPKEDKKHR